MKIEIDLKLLIEALKLLDKIAVDSDDLPPSDEGRVAYELSKKLMDEIP